MRFVSLGHYRETVARVKALEMETGRLMLELSKTNDRVYKLEQAIAPKKDRDIVSVLRVGDIYKSKEGCLYRVCQGVVSLLIYCFNTGRYMNGWELNWHEMDKHSLDI